VRSRNDSTYSSLLSCGGCLDNKGGKPIPKRCLNLYKLILSAPNDPRRGILPITLILFNLSPSPPPKEPPSRPPQKNGLLAPKKTALLYKTSSELLVLLFTVFTLRSDKKANRIFLNLTFPKPFIGLAKPYYRVSKPPFQTWQDVLYP